jgi:hypothetical protein
MKVDFQQPGSMLANDRQARQALTGLLTSLALMANGGVLAAEPAGMVKTLKGTATIERGDTRLPVAVGVVVFPKDRIVTGPQSSIGVTLKDNTQLALGANGQMDLNKFSFNTTSHVGELDSTVRRGSLSVISGKVARANPNAVQFNTGTVTLGVRGTEFIIEAGED